MFQCLPPFVVVAQAMHYCKDEEMCSIKIVRFKQPVLILQLLIFASHSIAWNTSSNSTACL